ncbi:glycosyltransferase [Bacteriovorax sp. Seq25_V]|uniref:glycosyltransferase n=1 Tax=Bacteriovorax sp. Seq25_V TaxID=1201288 RepID=UPI00038A14C5|nr:glycosyltransferase [Bacteriovorax sp. Seq25_V]EQC45318.1 glycosyltransferase, group 2 domain protein [Bacteriovorax sp. Seq25_V]
MKKISVIFSTFNEAENAFFKNSIEALKKDNEIEIIIIDYNSSDRTREICGEGVIFITTDLNSRAKRLKLGLSYATAAMVIFHHPRSLVDTNGFNKLKKLADTKIWGGFTHCFDLNTPILKFTSWYSNRVRGYIRGILYLDHCIFASKSLLNKINFPEVDIFEDTILSDELRFFSPPVILPEVSTTSAIRFVKNGQVKQAILNQVMKMCYFLKIDHKVMNKIYEFGINLNSKY